jgi:NitT/TauT family transport system substrate-binding protein
MMKRMVKPISLLLVMALALVALSSCGDDGAKSEELTKVSFRLDWVPGAQHAAFYLGKEKGYFEEEGIDLEIIAGSGSSDSVKQLGSHTIDMALVDALVLVQAKEQEVPVEAVAAYYQRTPITVMSPADKPVTSVDQLLGDVKLGSKKGSATYQGLIALLGANDIQQEQVKLVDIGFGVQPLLVGQVDAMMGFTMNEPIEAESAGMPVHELLIADHGVVAYGLTIASNDTFMEEHGDLVEGFLQATKKAMADCASEGQAAVDALANAVDEIDKERELKVLGRVVPFWQSADTDAHGYGWQSDAEWQSTVDTAVTLGLVSVPPQLSDVYTNDYLE